MAKEINAFYDESSRWKPTEEGQYPAHISGLTTKEMIKFQTEYDKLLTKYTTTTNK